VCALALCVSGCGGDDDGNAATESTGTLSTAGTTSEATGSAGSTEDASATSDEATTSLTDSVTDATTESTTQPETDSDTETEGTTEDPGTGEGSSFALTIDDSVSPPRMVKIDLVSGSGTHVCDLVPGTAYDSLAFGRNNRLYVHNATQDRLERVNPCDCGFQIIGSTGIGLLELAPDEDDGLLGLNLGFNAFLRVNAVTGLATVVGSLGIALDSGGIAWSDEDERVWVIDATADQLLVVDPATGMAGSAVDLSQAVETPGLAHDNFADTLYACSGNALLRIDPSNGTVTSVGNIGLDGPCHSLAIPFEGIACLE
jgi:hypothetical protein